MKDKNTLNTVSDSLLHQEFKELHQLANETNDSKPMANVSAQYRVHNRYNNIGNKLKYNIQYM